MKKITYLTIAFLSLSGTCYAQQSSDTYHQLNRFTKIKTDLNRVQSNPLLTIVKIKFPPSVKTVGDSIRYSLVESGYSLVPFDNMTEETKTLMNLPLPRIHRTISFVSLENLLKVLAGDVFTLLVDPVTRQISFVTNIEY